MFAADSHGGGLAAPGAADVILPPPAAFTPAPVPPAVAAGKHSFENQDAVS
jgi:hypothetical protein